jgi:hypothetical protein
MRSGVPTNGLEGPDEDLAKAVADVTSGNTASQYGEIRKLPFYSHVRSDQIGVYQDYLNRAFAICPTLEFDENDRRLNRLFQEATEKDALHELDLEMMMRQFINANGRLREKYRADWVERVLSRQADGFIPDPWDIIAAAFVK